ncbi:WD40-repeat-containing domain protein [Chlamydoabsidia padenii]|nr:WD40-repeat-containing domain protein [Chlamydoabsidia padenii]
MTLTSEEVNAIVYRYLQDSGFRHSSFAFQHESQVDKSIYRDTVIPPGMLINIIHKGLQFMDIETHMNQDGELVECNAPFSLLGSHQCGLTGTALQPPAQSSPNKRPRKEDRTTREKKEQREKRPRKEGTQQVDEVIKEESIPATVNGHTVKEEGSINTAGGDELESKQHETTTSPTTTTTKETVTKETTIIDSSEAVILTGHHSEVFSCCWNPVVSNLLVSGSGDATARLWKVPDSNNEVTEPIVLNHLPNLNDSKDVTSLDWNPSGTLLASGSYDGQARIWTQKGQLRFVMEQHRGPIFSLKWNRKGDLVLSGSADTTTVVWDPKTGEMKQQFELHSLAILDVDWMDNTTFASCSSDNTIYVCRVGTDKPLKKWIGHTDEINAVRWDPSGTYLASCSDDMTTKIWSLESDQPIQEIRGHQLQIYTLQWAPHTDDERRLLLATCSFDATIRLWDALSGTCLHVLKNHAEAVYSISFSPDAQRLASGSFDEILNVWDVKTGALQKTFRADGGIFEVHFNMDGSKLAACTSNRQVVILNMKS